MLLTPLKRFLTHNPGSLGLAITFVLSFCGWLRADRFDGERPFAAKR